MQIILPILNIVLWLISCYLWYRVGKLKTSIKVRKVLIKQLGEIQTERELNFNKEISETLNKI